MLKSAFAMAAIARRVGANLEKSGQPYEKTYHLVSTFLQFRRFIANIQQKTNCPKRRNCDSCPDFYRFNEGADAIMRIARTVSVLPDPEQAINKSVDRIDGVVVSPTT
ncbi:hypothetical protein [Scytonema sp. PCC 10023]|uniref:hypothetical protein n=1 Tax=Scytonema sp. PCC 10023 TaxID=1680591 RepID=UPI0039C6C98E